MRKQSQECLAKYDQCKQGIIKRAQYSAKQEENVKAFLKYYPNAAALMANFTISKWHDATTREHLLCNTPCIYLSQVDEAYQQTGLCRTIVGMNFSALFQMGGAKGNFNDTLFYAAVDRFIAKHGTQCTMYDLILYCDAYRDTYKDRFTSNEDISDYSKQFPLYLKHKAVVQDANKPKQEEPQQKKGEKKLVGIEALEAYLITAAKRGDNLLEDGLVSFGIVSREHAKEVMQKYAPEPF